jgi:hypothetical protein
LYCTCDGDPCRQVPRTAAQALPSLEL